MLSGWKDRKGRFSIYYFLDGMCLDTFVIVSRIQFVVCSFCFCVLSGGV